MTRRSIAVIALLLLAGQAGPASAGAYGTELPFVLGSSARVSGMGAAGVSLTGDASIQFYNPSALGQLQWKQFAFFRTTLYESSSIYHTLSYAQPLLDHGTIGLSLMRVDVGGVEERDDTNQLLSEDLHSSQTRVLLGYGRNLGGKFGAGFNIVFDNQSFAGYSGSGIGLDIGLTSEQTFSGQSVIKGFREGFTLRNVIEPSIKLDREKVADPTHIGMGFSILSAVRGLGMVTTFDLTKPRFSPLSLRMGQEMVYRGNYALRFGVDDASPTFGFGARYKDLSVDYAFRSDDFGDNHRFSLSVRFGTSLDERHAAERTRREKEIDDSIGARMDELEQSQITNSLAEGQRLLAERDYDAAVAYLEKTLLWDPGNAEATLLLASARHDQAIRLGRESMDDSDYLGALIHLRKALRVAPGDSTASALIALCEDRAATAASTAEMRNRALKTAIDLYAERRFVDALAGFEEVLRMSPENPLAQEYQRKCEVNIRSLVERLTLEAGALASKGDFEGAIRLLEKTRAFGGNEATATTQIDAYKQRMQAARLLEQPIEQPSAPARESQVVPVPVNQKLLEQKYARGMDAFDKGRFDDAIRFLSEVWSQDPQFHNVSTLLAKAYLFVGMRHYSEHDYAEAIAIWQRALTVDPSNAKTTRYLSKAREEVRRLGDVTDGY